MSMPGIDCWLPDCAPLDGVLVVCPQATLHTVLHIKRATKITRRFCIGKSPPPQSHLLLTLPQSRCFCKKSQVTFDYRGNRSAGILPAVARASRPRTQAATGSRLGGPPRFLVHLTA